MLRILLLVIGWTSLVGSIAESVIVLHAAALALTGAAEWAMTVETHIADHLSFFYWIIDIAYAVFSDRVVSWFLGWPTLVFYPVRVVASILIGGWALSAARRMKRGATRAS
jgi:hypothetical protein